MLGGSVTAAGLHYKILLVARHLLLVVVPAKWLVIIIPVTVFVERQQKLCQFHPLGVSLSFCADDQLFYRQYTQHCSHLQGQTVGVLPLSFLV